jgi:hypothetical protein
MNAINLKEFYFSNKIICSVIGHKIVKTRNVTNHFREYKCSICGLELTNDLEGHKISLTPELKNINEILINHFKKRNYTI